MIIEVENKKMRISNDSHFFYFKSVCDYPQRE
jgi:hypothetical protein